MYRATKVTLTGHSSVRMLNRELLAKAYAGRAEILIAMNKVLFFGIRKQSSDLEVDSSSA